jgi:hypothetical protein
MSAFGVIADVAIALRNVRSWPKADIDHCTATRTEIVPYSGLPVDAILCSCGHQLNYFKELIT